MRYSYYHILNKIGSDLEPGDQGYPSKDGIIMRHIPGENGKRTLNDILLQRGKFQKSVNGILYKTMKNSHEIVLYVPETHEWYNLWMFFINQPYSYMLRHKFPGWWIRPVTQEFIDIINS